MNEDPYTEPEEPAKDDDEEEADLHPIQTCRHCGSSECHGDCYYVMGVNTP